MFCSNCGERIDADSHFCVHCGHKTIQAKHREAIPNKGADSPNPPRVNNELQGDAYNFVQPPINNGISDDVADPNQLNETTLYDDMLIYVGPNASYYNQKWRTMDQTSKKSSWNFAAFFLTFFWLGYRRLFKEMFIIVGLLFVIELGVIFLDQGLVILPFVNYGIGLVVGIGLGLYGNYLYRRDVEKKFRLMRTMVRSQGEKEDFLRRNGGTSTGGVFGAIGIFIVYVCVIFYLLFSVFGAVTQVKNGNLYEYPDITVGEAFDEFFDKGKWQKQNSNASFQLIEYTGNKTFEGENLDIKIYFIIDNDDEFQFNRIVVNGKELDDYDYAMFIDFIFDDSAGLEYW